MKRIVVDTETTLDHKTIWPVGYLQAEAAYCNKEHYLFYAIDSNSHRALLRPGVLKKREEFRLLWNELKMKESNA